MFQNNIVNLLKLNIILHHSQFLKFVIPLMILFYIRLTSPEFVLPLYHTPAGIIIMTVSLAVYAGAYLWGTKIIQISI